MKLLKMVGIAGMFLGSVCFAPQAFAEESQIQTDDWEVAECTGEPLTSETAECTDVPLASETTECTDALLNSETEVLPAEPKGQHIEHDIKDIGYSRAEDNPDFLYVFAKGTISSYSADTGSFVLTSQKGEETEISAEGFEDIKDYVNSKACVWYTEDEEGVHTLLSYSTDSFWENVIAADDGEKALESTVQVEGTVTKYISFWLIDEKHSETLYFVETPDKETKIFSEDEDKTFCDYIKIVEGMKVKATVFPDSNFAYLISDVTEPQE